MLSQVDEAKTETDRAGAREKIQLAILGSYGEDGTLDEGTLKENLQEIPGADVGEQNLQEENLDVEVDGYTFEITKEGEIKYKGTITTPPVEDKVKVGEIVKENNKTYTDIDGDMAVIPVGFAIVPDLDNISEGLVISDKADDREDEGNQFVWIPVEGKYERNPAYAEGFTLEDDTDYLPEGIKNESDNVTNATGFYISRYEAGDDSVSSKRTSEKEGILVSKKGAYIYTYIKQTDDGTESGILGAKEKAKKFINNENVKSGLCTGIQWDMTMAFISSESRLDGENQTYNVTKALDSRHHSIGIEQSGQNQADKVCNIYDLEGNSREYIAEKNMNIPCVTRGGSYCSNYSASNRCGDLNGSANSDFSFRFVLYIM